MQIQKPFFIRHNIYNFLSLITYSRKPLVPVQKGLCSQNSAYTPARYLFNTLKCFPVVFMSTQKQNPVKLPSDTDERTDFQ